MPPPAPVCCKDGPDHLRQLTEETAVDQRSPAPAGGASLQGLLGHLNFSAGKPEARFQKQLDAACVRLEWQGAGHVWLALRDRLRAELASLKAKGAAAFQDTAQAEAVITLTLDKLLPANAQPHISLHHPKKGRERRQRTNIFPVHKSRTAGEKPSP